MLVTRQEIRNEIYRALKLDRDDVDVADQDSIDLRINQAQDIITFDRAWSWRKETFYLTTRKPVVDGTVTATEFSRTVKGSGTVWDQSMRNGYLIINTESFAIRTVVSATSIQLKAPYPNATVTDSLYSIVFRDYILPTDVSSILSIKLREEYLSIVDKSRLTLSGATTAEPQEAAMLGQSTEDFSNDATVTVTNRSATVTGGGTVFTDEMEGMSFRVNEFSKDYIIKSVDSDTQLTLTEVYEGNSGGGKSYAIGPKGSPVLTLRHAPDNYYWMEIEVLRSAPKLVSNTAYSIIPNHSPLLQFAIWLAFVDFKNSNPVRIQQARADAEKSLKQLRNSYKTISNVRWTSPGEIRARQTNASVFNPLRTHPRRLP